MADKTITIDVVDLTVPPLSHINIAVINQPNPVTGYSITGPELLNLIQFSKYKITETATGTPITGSNIYDYFPELNPSGGGGGGGGGGSVTVDTTVNGASTNPVQNKAIYNFVNSSVATNTANFIDTFDSLAELEAYSGTVTNNDYAFVIGTDSAGNTVYNRYKYNGSAWVFEYPLNNSSFTAVQWAAIQSGMTASDKSKLDGIEAGANKTVVDENLSATSTNPVQNKTVNAALAAKQDKLTFDSSPTESSTNPVTSGGVWTDQQRQETEIGAVANLGAKNLLKITSESQTVNGVTFTVNDDQTITVNGVNTSTTSTALFIIDDVPLPAGIAYTLSGCPSGGSFQTYYIGSLDTTNWLEFTTDIGNGNTATLNTPKTIRFRIGIRPGVTVDNLIFKPMLRRAEITDNTFVPYAPTNRELYETKTEQTETNVIANLGAKNNANFNFGGIVQNVNVKPGTIVCVESDGTFRFSGTTDDKNYAAYILKQFLLKAGTYKVSGVSGGSNITYWMRIGTGTNDTGLFNLYDAEREFNLVSDTLITIQVVIYANQTIDNLVISPMIRPASITDNTFVPYAKTNRELTVAGDEDRAALVEQVDEGAKNFVQLGFTSTSGSSSVPATTNNNDGTITVNGSRVGSATILVQDLITGQTASVKTRYTLPAGNYVIAPTGNENIGLQVYKHDGTNLVGLGNAKTEALRFSYSDTDKVRYPYICIRLFCDGDATINNFTFMPMVCTEADYKISPAIVPYRPSWQEMWEMIGNINTVLESVLGGSS